MTEVKGAGVWSPARENDKPEGGAGKKNELREKNGSLHETRVPLRRSTRGKRTERRTNERTPADQWYPRGGVVTRGIRSKTPSEDRHHLQNDVQNLHTLH